MKIKVIIAQILCLTLIFSLAACFGTDTDNTDKKEPAAEKSSAAAVTEAKPQKKEDAAGFTIEPTVCLDSDGVKVTATEVKKDGIWGQTLNFLIENNSENDYIIESGTLVINNIMSHCSLYEKVAAGKKANKQVHLELGGLTAAGIKNIGQIETYFKITDAATYKLVKEPECVLIKTSLYDKTDDKIDDSGTEVYNENGIRVVAKYVDDSSFWGASVLVYIENNSGKNYLLSCEDLSVNGFMVTGVYSRTIYDGKYAIDDINLLESDLKDNNITEIKDIELKFKIIDSDNFMNSTETDVIKIEVK